jgi:hypothetical protein
MLPNKPPPGAFALRDYVRSAANAFASVKKNPAAV